MNNKTIEKAAQFKALHLADETFIMANAWNAGSAILLEESGFKAIGTTSAGIVYSQGLPDYAGKLTFEKALEETESIANAINIPVSMDGENGYGHSVEQIFANLQRIASTGVVGVSIEDYTGDVDAPLYDLPLAVERILVAKKTAAGFAFDFTLTARAECYLTNHPKPFSEAVKRANLYHEAGADCLFVPGIKDIDTIAELVREVAGPISVVMGLAGTPISLNQLQGIGVQRISIGGSLARATFGLVRKAAAEMLEHGTFEFAKQQIADDELCNLFAIDTDR